MSISDIHAIWTVLLFVSFAGITVWVYFLRAPSDFDAAARLPFEDAPKTGAEAGSPKGRDTGESRNG